LHDLQESREQARKVSKSIVAVSMSYQVLSC
jgi:hypothetical protein